MNKVFIQIGFKESPLTHYITQNYLGFKESPSTHYITHKTIYMYFLNNSHDLLKEKVLLQI